MPDVFVSYSSQDRSKARIICEALLSEGFDVFWDQQVPTGVNWDTWIRQHLNQSKCAVILWTTNSVKSDNVQHEVTIAKQQGKLVPVFLEPINPTDMPLGLYNSQAANLVNWSGEKTSDEWKKLIQGIAAKATPIWAQRIIANIESELIAERSRREAEEVRDNVQRAQIVKQAQLQQDLKRERDSALDEMRALQAKHDASNQERDAMYRRASEAEARAEKSVQKSAAMEMRLDATNRAYSVALLCLADIIQTDMLKAAHRLRLNRQNSGKALEIAAVETVAQSIADILAFQHARQQALRTFNSQRQ
jgi:hypothetical protein